MRPSVKPMPKPKVDLDQPIFPQGVINVDEDSQTGPSETASSEVTVKKENFDVAASGSGGVKPEDHSAASASAGGKPDAGMKAVLQENRERSRSRPARRSAFKRKDSETTLVLGSCAYYSSESEE